MRMVHRIDWRHALCLWALLTGSLLGGRAPAASVPPNSAPPNVLLITLDTVRPDHLGCYGDRQALTPTLDALARTGTRFTQAYTTVPLTLPAHTTLLTGTYPFFHGVRDQPGYRLPDGVPTLAERFAAAGYATGAVLASPVLDARFGLNRGFSFYDDHIVGLGQEETAQGATAVKRTAPEVVRRGLAWLEHEGGAKPFFLWLHFYDAHLPYTPPAALRARFPGRPYDAAIAEIDATLGRFLATGKAQGWLANTTIVVLADHGEGLGEHGESTHGFFIYDATMRIPLLIRPAGSTQPHLVTAPTSIVDVAPTLLSLSHLPIPGAMQGSNRAAAVAGGDAGRATPIYLESYFPLLHLGWNPLRGLVMGEEKYIQAPRPEFYDLATDPGERHNIEATHQAPMAAFHEALDALVRQHSAHAASARSSVDRATAETFASLGYLGAPSGLAPVFTLNRRDPKDGIGEEEQLLEMAHAFQANNYPQAEARARAVLAHDHSQPLALDYLGTVLFERHDYQAAQGVFTQLVQAAPFYATGAAHLAHVDEQLGDRAAAEHWYRQAVALDPGDARSQRQLADLLLESGHPAEAEADLRRALVLQPDDVYALNSLSQILAERGDVAAAIRMLQQVVAIAPALLPPRLNLGFLELQAGQAAAAASLMRSTLRLHPRAAAALALLARAQLQQGQRAAAETSVRRALQLEPHNALALETLRQIKP